MSSVVTTRIDALRAAMKRQGIDAYLLPSSDPHQSEYLADHWKSREWFSGFTGSAGTLVVTATHAGLWTDSRYFLQAEQQLAGSGIVLHRQVNPGAPEHLNWLCEYLPQGATVGFDGTLFSAAQVRQMARLFYNAQIEITHHYDLVAEVWQNRPALPLNEAFEFDETFAGQSRAQKLEHIRAAQTTDFLLVSTLDDIAWTLNIRGNDVECNPVCISYLAIGKEVAYLFIEKQKISDLLRTRLGADGVLLKPYENIESFLQQLPEGKTIGLDATIANIRLYNAVPEAQLVQHDNIPRKLKAIKNETEIKHLRTAMRKDGVALLRLLRWLDDQLAKGAQITEAEVADHLDGLRREQGDYYGESFAAIVGYGSNGAIVHYRPEPGNCATLESKGILLLDSGGQYLQGTTDITRTIALGEPTEEQKRDNTLVLKGHIALAQARFPAGTNGMQLDAFARQPLWRQGLNFGHGTGHGVGFFLNVHEPPQGFAPNTGRGGTPFEVGMLTSNEPGLYRTGSHGIRIENLIVCVPAEENEFGRFLAFETLSICPIDKRLIVPALLEENERQWLNDYHASVLETLSPHIHSDELAWLKQQCSPLQN